ncbi:MAG: hypothetical protein AABX33_04475 [Nanoarchaeota archaeon]
MKIIKPTLVFADAIFISSLIVGLAEVFIFQNYDPKFNQCLPCAVELELLGSLFITIIGAAVFLATTFTLGHLRGTHLVPIDKLKLILILGILYPFVLILLDKVLNFIAPGIPVWVTLILWIYLIAMPMLSVVLIARHEKAHA